MKGKLPLAKKHSKGRENVLEMWQSKLIENQGEGTVSEAKTSVFFSSLFNFFLYFSLFTSLGL